MIHRSTSQYEFVGKTDAGRVRANNEDAIGVDDASGLAVLADGMGGYNAGEVASSMAVEYVNTHLARLLQELGTDVTPTELRIALDLCINGANRSILEAALTSPQNLGMGTTLVVGLFRSDRLLLAHVGDSRCYRLRDGALQQLTRDHSWLQEQIDAGLLTPQQAQHSEYGNLVTRALGVETMVQIDFNEFPVEPQDLYILCSDGLTNMIGDDDLAALAKAPAPLTEKAERMIQLANAMGGRDNISVVLVQAAGEKQKNIKPGLMSRLLRSY
ncbi:Stp1/IreP family PP2C-type Ser/Thr phosphatase [Diaphorobacter sp. HDW4A]|uniref:Stp1/IreP family PP2C-type Ser/Thr phosphatase n=1 Tax=Diaphorobacter sp. HDW4A TaxID=2714924 RepID=UPI00140E71EF|nr:Stp1/IreP family PP2C-type Ser/Thr phosphatase [Diaphorobacter sp. HDW4A]QIL82988.1 Stp1/IreP family PP2C-type Ser/Thr phosphatase [Diaphorobacter sp. HDW4A]